MMEQLTEVISVIIVFVNDYLQLAIENSSELSQPTIKRARTTGDTVLTPIVSTALFNAIKQANDHNMWDVFDDVLRNVAKNGSVCFPWPILRLIIACKVERIFATMLNSRRSRMLVSPLRAPDDLESLRFAMIHLFSLNIAPFTVQRAAEVLLSHKHYKNPRKLAFALAKILGNATLPLGYSKSISLDTLFPTDLSSMILTLNAAGPNCSRRKLPRSPALKEGRLSSSSSAISSLSTPLPAQKHLHDKRGSLEEEKESTVAPFESSVLPNQGVEDSLANAFWRDANHEDDDDDDEEEMTVDDEDTEEMFDKSNSEYVLSLQENPPPSRRLNSQKPLQLYTSHLRTSGGVLSVNQWEASKPVAPQASGGVADLLRDLDDDDGGMDTLATMNEQQSSNQIPPPRVPIMASINTTNNGTSKDTGLDLLIGYFDDEDISDTNTEAMKLLSDSLNSK